MTHQITMTDDRAELAYTGEKPWHGLGQELQPGAPIEEWATAAGMSWRIRKAFVRYPVSRDSANDSTQYRTSTESVVLFRGDNGNELGVVSPKFQVVQPIDTLEFFRNLVGTAGCELTTAGTLFDGRKFWAMATIGREAVVIDKRDNVRAHLLLSTACDGTMATEARFCATRVVCNNSLRIGRSEKGSTAIKVSHRTKFVPEKVKAELGIESAISEFDRTVVRMRALAHTTMSPDLVLLATCGLLRPDYSELDHDARDKVMRSKPVETIARLAIDRKAIGSDMDGASGTAYGWLNAVTQYVDHEARAKSDSHRMDSAFFGRNVAVKDRAFAMAGHVADSKSNPLASVNDWLAKHS